MSNQLKTQEQLRDILKKPLPAEAIKPHPSKTYLSSIKAIFVTERLNDAFGIGGWTLKTDMISVNEATGMVVCKVTLEAPAYGVYYESFGGNDNGGSNSKNFDLGDAFKGATTDGITKIGSYLEIGIDVFKGEKRSPESIPSAKSTLEVIDERSWLNKKTTPWKEAVKFLVDGGSIEKIEKKYRISKENRADLLSEALTNTPVTV